MFKISIIVVCIQFFFLIRICCIFDTQHFFIQIAS
jgi:hypothetical protein